MKHRKNIGFDKQRGNFGCALSSPGKIFASPNSVEIFVACYQAKKNFGFENSVEILVARYQAQEKITVNKIAWKFCGAHCSTSLHRFDNAPP